MTFFRFISNFFTSYRTVYFLLFFLAIFAALGTFIENEYGSLVARELIYTSWWYQALFFLISISLVFIMKKTKMHRVKSRFLFHGSFLIILIGAVLTHYGGVEGTVNIREGGQTKKLIISDDHDQNLPFSLKLLDFKLRRYPGSRSPSEFQSELEIIDGEKIIKKTVYMNHTLTYKGYKFFQTSYDTDEKGTVLSVNRDPGVELTYLGYFILFISLCLNLLSPRSRFQFLFKHIKKMSWVILLGALGSTKGVMASETGFIQEYLENYKQHSQTLANSFGRLVVQSPDGRMKPLDTQNREVLYKLTGRNTWRGLNSNQVALGMFSRPTLWKKLPLIKVKTPTVRKLLKVDQSQKLVSFRDFFNEQGVYKLSEEVDLAVQKSPAKRGVVEKDLIQVDERLNIAFMAYRGSLLTIFPIKDNQNNKWVDFKTMFQTFKNKNLKRSSSRFLDHVYNRQYEKAEKEIKNLMAFQKNTGHEVMPSPEKIAREIYYNKLALFSYLPLIYLLLGLAFFLGGLFYLFYDKKLSPQLRGFIQVILGLLMGIHFLGIIGRWYIAGYIPISSTYETMIYISLSALGVGFFLFKNSLLAMSAALMMAGVFTFTAYLGEVDPVITTLVPVLKSYWLSIHVSVITASYGFFGVGAFLGLICMVLFLFKKEKYDREIKKITYTNEMVLTLGLVLLVIGTFLGGIWANESWGRYWGWDPKETWAYISILVYTMALHLRLVKKVYSFYLFNVLSIFSFFSILMTYFGVNFYLAGMHSYAKGDPVPIPDWVYITVTGIILLILMAYPEKNKGK